MRIDLAASDNQMALLQGPALALPLIAAAVPLGLLIDRASRARLLVIFTALSLLGNALASAAGSFSMLFAARSLVGLSATATGTAAFSLLADLCAPERRGRATLVVAIGQFAGSSAAFALGGWLLAILGASPHRWRLALLELSAPLLIVLLATLALREPVRAESIQANPSAREAFAELWRYRAVIVPLLAGLVSIEIALQSALIWMAPALTRNFSLTPERAGAVMATTLFISGIAGPIGGGFLADLMHKSSGPRSTLGILSAAALLLAITAALFGRVFTQQAAGILVLVFMTLITALLVMRTALFTIVVPNELRGLCLSVFTSTTLVFGVGLGPLSVSALSGLLGGPALIRVALSLVAGAAGIVASVAFLRARTSITRSAPNRRLRG